MEKNKSFFDFDETIIRINSFPYWIVFIIIYSFFSFDFRLTAKFSKLLFYRKIQRKISHYYFKKELIKLSVPDNFNRKFAVFLSYFTRKKLIKEIKRLHAENHKIIISSAAPESYLKKSIENIFPQIHQNFWIIGSKLSFEDDLIDNYKEEKLHNLYKYQFLGETEMLKNIYTDSWDDAVLAYQSENLILIYPNKKSQHKYFSDAELAKKIRKF